MGMTLIVKVCENKKTKQKFVTIPQANKDILKGDYVKIIKVE